MKTEQEQIEQIENVLINEHMRTAYSVEGHKQLMQKGVYYCQAKSIVEAGYGDVSEYKAEIERLQSNTPQHLKDLLIEFDEMGFAPTTVCPNPDKYATEWRDRLVNCVNNATKQAKIDILNKAKEKLDSAPNGWAYTGYIDELIEEVENGEDKG